MQTLLQEDRRNSKQYNKTKDLYYKDLWYKLIKEWADGSYNTERWNVSVSSVNKTDDGTYVISGNELDLFDLCDIIRLKLTTYQ